MSDNAVEKWLEASIEALEEMEAERRQHELALERAMEEMRKHERAMDELERDMAHIRSAVDQVSTTLPEQAVQDAPAPPPLRPSTYASRGVA